MICYACTRACVCVFCCAVNGPFQLCVNVIGVRVSAITPSPNEDPNADDEDEDDDQTIDDDVQKMIDKYGDKDEL